MADNYKTYRANAEGFDGDKLRVEGEVFTTNIPQGSWMDLLDKDGNVVERAKSKGASKSLDAEIDTVSSEAAKKLKQAMAASEARIAELESELADAKARIAELDNAAGSDGEGGTGAAEPGPLDGSIADLTTYLDTVSDVGAIDALIEAEKTGKTRVGALEALEARKAALQGS